jgi:hypothetical protein
MNLLLAFAPFITFAIADRLMGATPGLIAGALVAVALVVRDVVSRKRIKILEVGTVVLFGGLAVYSFLWTIAWTIVGVRLWVDAGLLVIVLASLAVRQPFTVQYAREKVAEEYWAQPAFLRTNDIITAVWAAAFALMVIADLVMLYVPTVPVRAGVWITILAILGAYKFTDWYPRRKGQMAMAGDTPLVGGECDQSKPQGIVLTVTPLEKYPVCKQR